MAVSAEKLQPLGVESLAVVATELENARLYYRFRPMRLPLAVDPTLTTHQSYGVPSLEPTPELMDAMASVRVNPTGELAEPLPLEQAANELNRLEGYQGTETDRREGEQQFALLTGQFLIDRDGVVRWVNLEGQREGLTGIGKFPTSEELLSVVQIATSA